MEVIRPASVPEALAALARPGAIACGGGTAMRPTWEAGAPRPAALVTLDRLGLSAITVRAEGVRIGAGVTLDALARDAGVAVALPLLARAVADVAAPGVRRLATLGGQAGWGAGCLLPALLALEADIEIADATGEARMYLGDWLAAPRGLILGFCVPLQPDGPWTWRKTGLRAGFTPSMIAVAGIAAADGLRLAAGGGPVRPQRLTAAEAAGLADPEALRAAIAATLDAPDCPFRNAAWRRAVAARALVIGLTGDLPPVAPPPAARLPAARLPAGQAPLGLAEMSRAAQPDRWHPRPDLPAKIAGRAGYLTDHRAPGMLVARILRAGRPHARILSIDTSAAEAAPGVRAVVTHRDVPGLNAFGIMRPEQPALCADVVRHEGDMVAAVAADTAEAAEAALALIRVAYADLPVVDSPAAALAPGAPALHPGGNLAASFALDRGDPDAAFAAATRVVEDTYVCPRQMHGFLETEGGWCAPTPEGGLIVCVGGQHGARDRMQLARILAMPEQRIRVVTSPIGGGFGGRDELTVQAPLALLALKAGAAVRLHLSRAESVQAGIKRNPMTIRMRTACDAEGRLVAQAVDVLSDSGAYASLSPAVLETALEHAAGPYVVANVRTRGRLAYTNNGIGGAFRGFGANQMTFAIECQMDRLAALTGLDPCEIRRRNLRNPGTRGFLGQTVAPSERLAEMIEAAAASSLWAPPAVRGEWIEATGMAINYQGNGLGTLPPDERAAVLALAPDGMIEIACGLEELGQGLIPALQAAVAAHLGCARGDVRAVYGDTGSAPYAGSTSASHGGFVVWQAAAHAAPVLARRLIAAAGRILGQPVDALRIVPGGVGEARANDPLPLLTFADLARLIPPGGLPTVTTQFAFPKADYTAGNARFIFAFGATLARVAISRVTGEVRFATCICTPPAGR
jgi:CO/xanthine dehydrogenase Mo-binding subunit/CO/xanthine dehydrogenase FAD-binding subunit